MEVGMQRYAYIDMASNIAFDDVVTNTKMSIAIMPITTVVSGHHS